MAKASTTSKIAAGIGLATLAAAAATVYYFSGAKGRQRRAKASAWVKAAKTDMVSEIKKTKAVTKDAYNKAAKTILAKYKQLKNIKPEELGELRAELQDAWGHISKTVSSLGQNRPKRTKKTG